MLLVLFLWRAQTNTTSGRTVGKPPGDTDAIQGLQKCWKLLPRLEGRREEVMSLEAGVTQCKLEPEWTAMAGAGTTEETQPLPENLSET